MEVVDIRPMLAPLISFVCAGLVFATGRAAFWRRFWSLAAAVAKLAVVMSMLPGALRGTVYVFKLVDFTPGVGLGFRADALGMFFAVVSSTLWIFTTIYAIGYMEREHSRMRFFGFFALCVSTTVGIAFAENLLTLFLFYETLTICTYPLVIHEETPEAFKAGRKYLTYTLIGGAFVLIGTVVVYNLTGTLSLAHPGILTSSIDTGTLGLLFVALIAGFGVKAAIMPLHGWLPSAMVAPTPVSALLHAVAVVKAGAFGVLRVIYNVFGVELLRDLPFAHVLAYLAAFTIVTASFIALFQDNIKRRLAYSTISQLSYIVLGAALLTPLAATAAIVHIANQAFAKITMFFVAGAIQRTTGKTCVHELAGIGYRMPYTMAAFTIAALSFIGVPLFAGFVTKWYLSLGALEAGDWWFVVVLIASALLNAAYWLPIVYLAYFKAPPGTTMRVAEARPTLLVPTLICAGYVLLLGTTANVPGMPFSLARAAVQFVFGM
ncbi:MAG: monovalent cation/H+ antiporter subunit D family protein [Anaerosomatales bacterium]|nr:monovalent cation/H+ antiporter subunit D family protein [Anaerosomatales bacterium]